MFKIGEFSRLTQVSVRMLRYYDEMNLLKPAKIDETSHYRLYGAEQISTLNKIVFLRDLGFGVSEIAAALAEWNDEAITKLLADKRREIESRMQSERDKLSKIALAQRDIRQEKIKIHYNVSIKSVPSHQVLALRRVVADYYAEGALWKEMSAFAKQNHIPVSHDVFSVYHDPDYRERNVDIEICAPVARMGEDAGGFVYRCTEPVPLMACTMVRGAFENIAGAYLSFASWLQAHDKYRMGQHSRQIVHRGPWNEEDPGQYLTEIQIPLAKK